MDKLDSPMFIIPEDPNFKMGKSFERSTPSGSVPKAMNHSTRPSSLPIRYPPKTAAQSITG